MDATERCSGAFRIASVVNERGSYRGTSTQHVHVVPMKPALNRCHTGSSTNPDEVPGPSTPTPTMSSDAPFLFSRRRRRRYLPVDMSAFNLQSSALASSGKATDWRRRRLESVFIVMNTALRDEDVRRRRDRTMSSSSFELHARGLQHHQAADRFPGADAVTRCIECARGRKVIRDGPGQSHRRSGGQWTSVPLPLPARVIGAVIYCAKWRCAHEVHQIAFPEALQTFSRTQADKDM